MPFKVPSHHPPSTTCQETHWEMNYTFVPWNYNVQLSSSRQEQKKSMFFWPLFNPFAPEPPVTARADPRPFYPL